MYAIHSRPAARTIARFGLGLVILTSLSACGWSFSSVEKPAEVAIPSEPVGQHRSFAASLQRAYLGYANQAYERSAYESSEFFARRSIMSSGDELPLPAKPLDTPAHKDLALTHRRLWAQFRLESRRKQPAQTARAQAAYDCWLREEKLEGDSATLNECRMRAKSALTLLERTPRFSAAPKPADVEAATIASPKPAPKTSAPKPTTAQVSRDLADQAKASTALDLKAAAAPREGDFVLFFEFGRSNITPEAAQTLLEAVDEIAKSGAMKVTLFGYADRRGSKRANRRISIRRAQSVRRLLRAHMGQDLSVDIIALGESKLPVQTADGVAEALNRRVEIRIDAKEEPPIS